MASHGPSQLTGSELIAFGKRMVTEKLQARGCTVTASANPRDGKLDIETPSGRSLEVFVSTQRVGGYALWTKRRLQLASHRFAIVVLFDADPVPRLYLVPSREWVTTPPPLTDRDYEGKPSEPEYGIELTSWSLPSLDRYAWSERAASEHFN